MDTLVRCAIFALIVPAWAMGSSFWLHLLGTALFAFGLGLTLKREKPLPRGVDGFILFGPVFFATPMAVFGMQHFSALNVVRNGVPPWMPGHLFWACFVGAALIAAAVSIITGIQARVAALLLGVMLFLFVLLIYVPNLVRNPYDRFALILPFRDLALSGGALALAGTLAHGGRPRAAQRLVTVGRFFFAVAMVIFGVEHFPHPDFAPGVPLPRLMPGWMPAHQLWAWVTGAALIVGGLSIALNKRAHLSAAWLGAMFLLLTVCIYLPLEIIHPSIEISGELDYVADTLAMSGAALLVAGALPGRAAREITPARTDPSAA